MRRIVDERWPVKYPPYMSPAAKDLIMRLLERKPAKRIGMLQGRAADIKNHKWFTVRQLPKPVPSHAALTHAGLNRARLAHWLKTALQPSPHASPQNATPPRRTLTGPPWPHAAWSRRAGPRRATCPSARRSWRTPTAPTRRCRP